jgi:peptidoglycan/LPS O-acetylase OafA/YrhL
LDGLRAVSVTAVAYAHWLPAWQFGVPFGAGVHLFFVLSGYLITRLLLPLRDAPHRGRSIGRFYARRALRLFPAFYAVLAAAWLADVPLAAETWPWHATYLSNVFIAARAEWQGHFSHFWSLAVEEQFYLLWPWVIVGARAAWLGPALVATLLAGVGARAIAASRGLGEPFWALVPAGSADSLAVGGLIAWWTSSSGPRWQRPWPAGAIAGAAALVWIGLAVAERSGPWPPAVAVWRQLVQGVVFGWIVWRATGGFSGAAGRLLGHPAMVAVGRISYGIYLVHAFAPIVVDALLRAGGAPGIGVLGSGTRALAAGAASLVMATALWHLVEAPWHRLKARFA